MLTRWGLIVADFRREYGTDADTLAGMAAWEFRLLLQGLSDTSRFRKAWGDAPKHLHNPDDIAAVTAAARR